MIEPTFYDAIGLLGELLVARAGVMDWSAYNACDELVQRLIAQGDYRQALEVLVRGYQHLIVRHCTALLGDTTQGQEVAQEVFLGAYTAMPRFRQEASVRTWLFAIARKQCFKVLRDRRRRRQLEEDKWSEIRHGAHREPPPPLGQDPDELLQRVRQGLDKLGRDKRGREERALLLLRYDTDLTLAEIANILGCSEASVRRQLVRAVQHLREVMDDEPG
jgi:RNA polymerase sigma-70 factor (ECF subfamily)